MRVLQKLTGAALLVYIGSKRLIFLFILLKSCSKWDKLNKLYEQITIIN